MVEVYAPMPGTAWEYTMYCPEVTTTTTTTSSSSSTTTTTTTVLPECTIDGTALEEEPTTTTTTTTESSTTTTTTTILCEDYYNNTGGDFTGIDYTACDGTPYTNQTVGAGQSICIQPGTLSGGDSGFLILLGNC